MTTEYFNGDDIVIDLDLIDAAGDPLPPSTLNSYKAEIRRDNSPGQIYDTIPQGDVEVLDDTAGEVRLRVDRSATATYSPGFYNVFFFMGFIDADAEAGERVEQFKVEVFEIKTKY